MAIVLALVLIVLGSVIFHVLSPWWWTPIASNWGYIDKTITITFWITGVVFAAVILFMAYCVFKFRHKEGSRAHYEPENRKLEGWLTVVTGIGVAALLAPGLVVWHRYISVPDGASEIEVFAQQWTWSYRLPGEDKRLGRSQSRLVGPDNPLGLDPADRASHDDIIIESDTLHLPVDKPVKVLLRSIDVLHNFYVPEFRSKMDMVPGMVTYFWLTPTRLGEFEVLCAELCGLSHAFMRGSIQIDTQEDYVAWLQQQSTFAELSVPALARAAGQDQP